MPNVLGPVIVYATLTVPAQILEPIKKIHNDLGTAVILISHDLGAISGDRIRPVQ